MVKNTTGGSKHKSQARKNVVSRGVSGPLRLATEEGEIYAQVERILGGCNCHVKCTDGETRLCVIRGKFRGRGKRDNMLSIGTLVLVGIRDYESNRSSKDKLQNCDLLEVYRETDKERVKNSSRVDWSKLVRNDNNEGSTKSMGVDYEFDFLTDEQEELARLATEQSKNIMMRIKKDEEDVSNKKLSSSSSMVFGDDDDIGIDDI